MGEDRISIDQQERNGRRPKTHPFPYVQHGFHGKTKTLKNFSSESDWVPRYENARLDR